MNLKKFLQRQAEKDAENLLTEKDELFIQQLVQNTEVKCGNCRYWHPWKQFARKGELSVRRAVQKGAETGCDGKCCCYESRELQPGPRASWDTLSASHCNYYSPFGI